MPAFFVPARSSRHRAACFALYRALLRLIPRIPLPADITSPTNSTNVLQALIRKAFARNKRDTSPRLVISALQNGYKFLSVLAASQTTSSPEHVSILAFLRKNQAEFLARQEAAALAPKNLASPRPGTIPLLRKLPPLPGTTMPRYEATQRPLPLSQLKGGVRKVPVLEDGNGMPFLRLSNVQPPILSRMIGNKRKQRQARIEKVIQLRDEGLSAAMNEDQWEDMLADLGVRDEGGGNVSYTETVQAAIQEVDSALLQDENDRVARGKALWKIVEQEQALAKKEAEERDAGGRP